MKDRKVEEAKTAIDKVFSDVSVPPSVTMERLKDVREHLNVLIEAVSTDLEDADE